MNDQATSASAYAEQAFYFIERRRLAEARRILQAGLTHFPDHPDLLFHSAQVEWLDDDHVAAEKSLRQVLAAQPEHAPARELLADLLMAEKRFAESESVLLGLLREYPESPGLYGRYSQLMLRTMHFDKAARLATEGLRYDPQDRECLLAEALCNTARHGGRSNQALSRLLAAHPESLSTVHALVVSLVEGGRVNEAHRVAQGALRADPANEHLVSLVRELRLQNHWSMLPLWPMQKWGWGGAAGMWVLAIVIMRLLQQSAPEYHTPFAVLWIGYAIYSWVWPSLARKVL
jgi:predicted Zn-dependent protease